MKLFFMLAAITTAMIIPANADFSELIGNSLECRYKSKKNNPENIYEVERLYITPERVFITYHQVVKGKFSNLGSDGGKLITFGKTYTKVSEDGGRYLRTKGQKSKGGFTFKANHTIGLGSSNSLSWSVDVKVYKSRGRWIYRSIQRHANPNQFYPAYMKLVYRCSFFKGRRL